MHEKYASGDGKEVVRCMSLEFSKRSRLDRKC